MFFPSRMFGVDGLMADNCLLCLWNFLLLHSLMSFSLILSVLPLLLQTPQWLQLWLMGWFRAGDTQQGRTLLHRVDTIRFELQEVVSSVTQLVWEPEFCGLTWCSVLCVYAVQAIWVRWCVWWCCSLLTGDGGFMSLEIDDVISGGVLLLANFSSQCLFSRGAFVLGFQILTRHRSVPWKSSWHIVRRAVLLPVKQTQHEKLENAHKKACHVSEIEVVQSRTSTCDATARFKKNLYWL